MSNMSNENDNNNNKKNKVASETTKNKKSNKKHDRQDELKSMIENIDQYIDSEANFDSEVNLNTETNLDSKINTENNIFEEKIDQTNISQNNQAKYQEFYEKPKRSRNKRVNNESKILDNIFNNQKDDVDNTEDEDAQLKMKNDNLDQVSKQSDDSEFLDQLSFNQNNEKKYDEFLNFDKLDQDLSNKNTQNSDNFQKINNFNQESSSDKSNAPNELKGNSPMTKKEYLINFYKKLIEFLSTKVLDFFSTKIGRIVSIFLSLIVSYFGYDKFSNDTHHDQTISNAQLQIEKPAQLIQSNTQYKQYRNKPIPEVPKFVDLKIQEKPIVIQEKKPNVIELPPLPEISVKSTKQINIPKTIITSPILESKIEVNNEQDEELQRLKMERKNIKMRSSIMLMQNGSSDINNQNSNSPNDFEPSSEIKTINIKRKGNIDYVLNKGKVIYAILETAMDTDIGGNVSAVISQNVYSQSAKNILIPRGSKIFGLYAPMTPNNGSNKVNIAWNRIDLPSGKILELDAISINGLGVPGAEGKLDMKYTEKIFNAILTSSVSLATSYGLDKLTGWLENSSAPTASIDAAKGIRSTAADIFNDTNKTEQDKITAICTKCKDLIQDKNSDTYKTLDQFCFNLSITTQGDNKSKLNSLMAQINSISDSLLQNNNQNTNLDNATKDVYNNISNTLKDLAIGQNDKPNIKIDQGKVMEIYVNQDYNFPREIVQKVKFF